MRKLKSSLKYVSTVVLLFHSLSAVENKNYMLNIDAVPRLLHQTTITTLLKSKARHDLSILSHSEKVLYQQCEKTASNIIDLAKCVSKLIRFRSRHLSSRKTSYSVSAPRILVPNIHNQPIVKKRAKVIRLHEHFEKMKKIMQRKRLVKRDTKVDNTKNIIEKRPNTSYKIPLNIQKLRKIEKYLKHVSMCRDYMKTLERQNERILSSQNIEARFYNQPSNQQDPINNLLESLNKIDFSALQILSPKFLEILPSSPDDHLTLASPSLLGLREDQPLSLPRILKISTQDDIETLEWLEIIMQILGIDKKLSRAFNILENEINYVEETVFPKVKKLQQMEEKVKELEKSLDEKQLKALREQGFSRMTSEQARVFYESKELDDLLDSDETLEEMIHELADFKESKRTKRQIGKVNVFQPYAFVNKQLITSVLGLNILSPYAFFQELLAPRMLGSDIFVPRAFVSSVLSPTLLVSRILSPSALRYKVLSPSLLTASILTPETLKAAVLSPNALGARVLSPDFLTTKVLSPSMGSFKVLSPSIARLLVLSPSIFGTNIFSKNEMVIQILSPSVLGISINP